VEAGHSWNCEDSERGGEVSGGDNTGRPVMAEEEEPRAGGEVVVEGGEVTGVDMLTWGLPRA
jgi:hypothetical protein